MCLNINSWNIKPLIDYDLSTTNPLNTTISRILPIFETVDIVAHDITWLDLYLLALSHWQHYTAVQWAIVPWWAEESLLLCIIQWYICCSPLTHSTRQHHWQWVSTLGTECSIVHWHYLQAVHRPSILSLYQYTGRCRLALWPGTCCQYLANHLYLQIQVDCQHCTAAAAAAVLQSNSFTIYTLS